MRRVLRRNEAFGHKGYRNGTQVCCGEGILWITQAGDGRDHFLRTGQSLTLSGRGRIVVMALTPRATALIGQKPQESVCGEVACVGCSANL